MSLSKTTIEKQISEKRLVTMNFDNKMSTAENIISVDTVTAYLDDVVSSDLTFSGQTYSGQQAQFFIEGGVIPARADVNFCDYKVTVEVTTDLGQMLENDGILRVQED